MQARSQLHAPVTLHPGKNRGTHCMGGWVGTRAGLGVLGGGEVFPVAIRAPDHRPARSLVVILTDLPRLAL